MTHKDNIIKVPVPQSVAEGGEAARVAAKLYELKEEFRYRDGATVRLVEKKDGYDHEFFPSNLLEVGTIMKSNAGNNIRMSVEGGVDGLREQLEERVRRIMGVPESTEGSGRKAA